MIHPLRQKYVTQVAERLTQVTPERLRDVACLLSDLQLENILPDSAYTIDLCLLHAVSLFILGEHISAKCLIEHCRRSLGHSPHFRALEVFQQCPLDMQSRNRLVESMR